MYAFTCICCAKRATQHTANNQDASCAEGLYGMSAGKCEGELPQTDRQAHMHLTQPQQGRRLIVCHHAALEIQDAVEG